MSSSVFSSCCDAFQSVDNSETNASKISRNVYKKNKTCNIVTSPKASLKYLNNNKTIKSPEDSVRQQNIFLTSTVNVAEFSKTENFAKRIQPNKPEVSFLKVPFVQKIVYLTQARPVLLTPSSIKQPTSSRTVHIQKVNFSYNNSKSKQPSPRQPITSPFTHITIPSLRQKISPRPLQKVEQIYKEQGKLKQSKILSELPKQIVMGREESLKSNCPFQHILQLENRNSLPNIYRLGSKQQKQKERKEAMENRKTAPSGLVFNKYSLGGSKFTVLSQEEVEQVCEQKQLRLEQSAILVNVFNPTNSQMKNWQVKKSKLSQIQQLNSNRK